MKKKGELSFSPIVYAILALIVLAVCIGVFFSLTKGPLASLFNSSKGAGENTDNTMDELSVKLGGCEGSETKCVLGQKYKCNSDGKWEKTGNDC